MARSSTRMKRVFMLVPLFLFHLAFATIAEDGKLPINWCFHFDLILPNYMALPVFYGEEEEDAYWWILCVEKFFKEQGTRETLKVVKAITSFRGHALRWWLWRSQLHPPSCWDTFTSVFLWHFKSEWREILPISDEEEELVQELSSLVEESVTESLYPISELVEKDVEEASYLYTNQVSQTNLMTKEDEEIESLEENSPPEKPSSFDHTTQLTSAFDSSSMFMAKAPFKVIAFRDDEDFSVPPKPPDQSFSKTTLKSRDATRSRSDDKFEEELEQKHRPDVKPLEVPIAEKELKKREKKDILVGHQAEQARKEALKDDFEVFTVVIGSRASVLDGYDGAESIQSGSSPLPEPLDSITVLALLLRLEQTHHLFDEMLERDTSRCFAKEGLRISFFAKAMLRIISMTYDPGPLATTKIDFLNSPHKSERVVPHSTLCQAYINMILLFFQLDQHQCSVPQTGLVNYMLITLVPSHLAMDSIFYVTPLLLEICTMVHYSRLFFIMTDIGYLKLSGSLTWMIFLYCFGHRKEVTYNNFSCEFFSSFNKLSHLDTLSLEQNRQRSKSDSENVVHAKSVDVENGAGDGGVSNSGSCLVSGSVSVSALGVSLQWRLVFVENVTRKFCLDDLLRASQNVVPVLTPSNVDLKLLVNNVDVVKSAFEVNIVFDLSLYVREHIKGIVPRNFMNLDPVRRLADGSNSGYFHDNVELVIPPKPPYSRLKKTINIVIFPSTFAIFVEGKTQHLLKLKVNFIRLEIAASNSHIQQGRFRKHAFNPPVVMVDDWLHTSDIGEWLSNGAMKIIDRKKNIFAVKPGRGKQSKSDKDDETGVTKLLGLLFACHAKVMFMGIGIFSLQQLSDLNVVFYFSSAVFESFGVPSKMKNNYVSTCNLFELSCFNMDKLGKKVLLQGSLLDMTVTMGLQVFAATYYEIGAIYLLFGGMLWYCMCYSFAFGAAPVPCLGLE